MSSVLYVGRVDPRSGRHGTAIGSVRQLRPTKPARASMAARAGPASLKAAWEKERAELVQVSGD